MKAALLFLIALLSLSAFCSAHTILGFSQRFSPSVTSFYVGEFPPRYAGAVNISVNASEDVEMCLQPYLALKSDLTNCIRGGYFKYSPSDSSKAQPEPLYNLAEENGASFGQDNVKSFAVGDNSVATVFSTEPKYSIPYYLSVLVDESDDSNSTFVTLNIAYDESCGPDQVGSSGGACIPYTAVEDNHANSNSLAANSAEVYQATLTENYSLLTVTVHFDNATDVNAVAAEDDETDENVQVYLRQNALPNKDNQLYDGAYDVANNTYTVTVESPLNGDYYLIITNSNNNTVETVTNFQAKDSCNANYYGPYCTPLVANLDYQINATEVNGTGTFQYFTVNNPNLRVGAAVKDLSMDAPQIFVSYRNDPTNTSYMANTTNSDDNVAYLHAVANYSDFTGPWRIAVIADVNETYYIWANIACANNCTGSGNATNVESHGTCDDYTGTCDCDSGYNGLFCDKKSGLALIWIILIVIAVIILVVVCIIVPIVYYMRNNQRARYERV